MSEVSPTHSCVCPSPHQRYAESLGVLIHVGINVLKTAWSVGCNAGRRVQSRSWCTSCTTPPDWPPTVCRLLSYSLVAHHVSTLLILHSSHSIRHSTTLPLLDWSLPFLSLPLRFWFLGTTRSTARPTISIVLVGESPTLRSQTSVGSACIMHFWLDIV